MNITTTQFAVSNNMMRRIREQLKCVLNARNLDLVVDEVILLGKSHIVNVPETNKVVAVFTTADGITVGHGEAYYNASEPLAVETSRNAALAMLHANVRNELYKMEQYVRSNRLEWHVANVLRAVGACIDASKCMFGDKEATQLGEEKLNDIVNNVMFYFRNPAACEVALHEVLCATRRVKDVPYESIPAEAKLRMSLERSIAKGFIPELMEY